MNSHSTPPGIGPTAFLLTLISILFICGFSLGESDYAKAGDTVNVSYSLSLPGGPVFETNVGKEPYTFVLGTGAVIKGFDAAITGMIQGETKTVVLTPEEAYGERNESLVRIVPLMEASDMIQSFNKTNISISFLPGYPAPVIEYMPPEGKRQRYLFTNITNETVSMDTNKPLAGKSLQFEIKLLEIQKKG